MRHANVDILKFLAIITVVWQHTCHPHLNATPMALIGDSLFFFLSGFFFRPNTALPQFLKRTWRRLIIPFIGFFIISLFLQNILGCFEADRIIPFNTESINEIFLCTSSFGNISCNATLWFLVALIDIQLISWLLFRLPRPVILITAIAMMLIRPELWIWPTYFMYNQALLWYPFFAIGYLCGKPLLNLLDKQSRIIPFLCCTSLLILAINSYWLDIIAKPDFRNLLQQISLLLLDVTLLCLLTPIAQRFRLRVLNYLGANTIAILGMNVYAIIFIEKILFKLMHGPIDTPLLGLLVTFLSILIMLPATILLNRYFPALLGHRSSPSTPATVPEA